MNKEQLGIYYDGVKEGIRQFAWWKDGTQYVGTCGTTLEHALVEVDKDYQQELNKLEK